MPCAGLKAALALNAGKLDNRPYIGYRVSEQKLDFNRVLPIFVLVFVDMLGLTVILPLLHLYAAAFGATPLQIGITMAAFPISQLLGVPIMGALSDRYGRKPLLLISQITTCISFIMLGMANSLGMIVLSRVIDGLFGANFSTAQAALSDITTEKTRTQGLGVTGAAFGLGFVLGPAISLVSLELTDSLRVPAFVAAIYSIMSILLTLFVFQETLPSQKRRKLSARPNLIHSFLMVDEPRNSQVKLLLLFMFLQQLIFFGFESLLGLFTLSRLGLLGQGNALIFLVVGITLVVVQVRYIGRWSRKYGEQRLIQVALALLATGLILLALTPEQPQPFYVRQLVQNKLQTQSLTSAEAVIGKIAVELPKDGNNGLAGLLWLFVIMIPISVGAGLIRPSLNSLMTKYVHSGAYGRVLGTSASSVSAANAIAPLLAALLFQSYGPGAPFLLGGFIMGALFVVSLWVIQPPSPEIIPPAELAS
jgi:MFS transporter, DHA1 family, tetracycline resistance protein